MTPVRGAALVVALGCFAPTAAVAKPKASKADEYLAEGRRQMQAGNFQGALPWLEAASREQNSDPTLWWDMGWALKNVGREADAMDAFQKFIVRADKATPEQKQQAQQMISSLDASITAARPAPKEPPPPPPPPGSGGKLRLRTWIAGGATVALGAGTVVMGLLARGRYNELRDGCGRMPPGCDGGDVDGLDRRILFTNVLLGLTAASAVATGALVYLDLRGGQKEVGVAWTF